MFTIIQSYHNNEAMCQFDVKIINEDVAEHLFFLQAISMK